MKSLRIAEYPGPIGLHDEQTIARNVRAKLVDQIVAGLTAGLGEARDAAANAAWDPRAVVFTGTLDEINRHFLDQDWSDGLPIVPPTVERVEAFMRHCTEPYDKPISTLQSANLAAVPWNIAVNGVMAGCSPEHMPILVAAARALGDDRASLANLGSTSMIVPYVLINGPIVEQLGLATGAQLVSRGPNPAIGRAIGLMVRNIAGYRPGKTYMGTFGYPLVVALAEDPKASPWPTFQVDQGFGAGQNTVTIGVTNNWGPLPAPASAGDVSAAQVALDLTMREITKKHRLFDFPGRGARAEKAMLTILMSPAIARTLADEGYDKPKIKQYLYENTRMPLREFQWIYDYTTPGLATISERVRAGVFPEEYLGDPESMVRLLSSSDMVHIVVCGDPDRNRLMVLEGGHTEPTTKEIVLRQ